MNICIPQAPPTCIIVLPRGKTLHQAHQGQIVIPRGETQIVSGDRVLVLARAEQAHILEEVLA